MRKERESLILRLQEQNTEIVNTIEKLHHLRLNQQIIRESQREDKSSSLEEDDFSIEYVQEEQKPQSTAKGKSDKKAERKEGFERARVWHLDQLQTKTKSNTRY